MDYKSTVKERFKELQPGANGRFQAEWRLTDTKLMDAVTLTLPPVHAIPIIFVPGIMGSNLANLKNKPVWLLNSIGNIPVGLALNWAAKNPGERQKLLHPDRTKVYTAGAVPKSGSASAPTQQELLDRGWGEVSEASYHKFLLWLDKKMNGDRNPANWEDFSNPAVAGASTVTEKMTNKLPPGLVMKTEGLPNFAEAGYKVDPIVSDELLKRSKFNFPLYAFGYNWLNSNDEAAKLLKERIETIVVANNIGSVKCTQVFLVTHSMGGLVARACSQLPDVSNRILGIVHGVMPSTGAAVAYRRCKVGMRDEDYGAGLVIGSNGKEVTAVFAQSPGALQLLPSADYGTKWLEVIDPSGAPAMALPVTDPYEEIYLQKNKWWGLIREEWLSPEDGAPIIWGKFASNIKLAKEFHRKVAGKYHANTYSFFGGGSTIGSFSKIRWTLKKGIAPAKMGGAPSVTEILNLHHDGVRTDGSNNLYIGGETVVKTATESSYWEVRCDKHDSAGDGTVPTVSGRHPRKGGGMSIRQQFELEGVQHEPAYRDYPTAQQVTYYAITKLAAMANLS